jgi:hypothetical protein
MLQIIIKKKCLGSDVAMKLVVVNGSTNFVLKCQMMIIKNIHRMMKNGSVNNANKWEHKITQILKDPF